MDILERMKKGIFWGALIAAFAFIINALHHAFGGGRNFGRGPGGHGPGRMMAQQGSRGQGGMMAQQGGFGKRGGFEPHQFFHHGGDFHWLGSLFFLVIVVVVLVLLVKWRRRRAKSSSKLHIDTTAVLDIQTPVGNPNATILDQWEKELMKKKENE
jgi:hypothetical protein